MTVPAFSVSAVLPGAPIPSMGTGVAASASAGGLFESLLAGFGEAETASAKVGPANEPLDTDLLATEAADQTQGVSLAMMMFAPAPASTPTAPVTWDAGEEATADVTSAPARVSNFARWTPSAAESGARAEALASPSTVAAPDPGPGTVNAASIPTQDATAGTERPVKLADVSTWAQTSPSDPKAETRLSTRPAASGDQTPPQPVIDPPAAAAKALSTGSVQPPLQTPTVAAAPTVPGPSSTVAPGATPVAAPAPTAVVDALAAAAAPPAPPAPRVPSSEGETRRAVAGRAGRPAEAAGRPVGAPSVDTPARQAALAVVTDGAANGIEADAGADVADLDLVETPETRQPALPAEVRAQAAQNVAVAAEAAATRSSAETVARLAADIVHKADGQSTRFDLQLDPYGLGKVDVALEIDRNGKLTAALSFDSAQSAADLRGRAGELRQALEQAGFDIAEGDLTFGLSGQGAGFGGREAGQQQDRAWNGRAFQRAQMGAEAADLSLASTPSTLSPWTRSGVDIRI